MENLNLQSKLIESIQIYRKSLYQNILMAGIKIFYSNYWYSENVWLKSKYLGHLKRWMIFDCLFRITKFRAKKQAQGNKNIWGMEILELCYNKSSFFSG